MISAKLQVCSGTFSCQLMEPGLLTTNTIITSQVDKSLHKAVPVSSISKF